MMILEFLEVDEDEDFIEIRDQWWFNPNSIQGATSWSFNVFEYVRGNDLYLVKFAGYILGTVPYALKYFTIALGKHHLKQIRLRHLTKIAYRVSQFHMILLKECILELFKAQSGFIDKYKINKRSLYYFLKDVQNSYNYHVPYHNATHATDILQAVYYALNKGKSIQFKDWVAGLSIMRRFQMWIFTKQSIRL